MKKLFILLGVVLGNLVFAQTPQFIHYQAVIRDGNGAVLSNQTVSLKIEITQGQNTYTEIRTVNTNNVGLVNLSIGNLPAPNSIPFSSINWAGGSTSMLTWYDPTGSGSNWQYISSSDIASVPYALHAANVFSGDFNDLTNVPSIDSSNTNEIQTISAQGDTIYLSNGGQIYYGRFSGNFADLNGVPAIDTSYTNELQTIAKNGDTISLSNGGGSVVVNTFSGDFNDLSNVPNLDTSNTNELQVLSMSGDTLYLSNGGFAVIPIDKWSESNGVVYRNSRVGINSINPDAQLEVNSTSSASNSQLGLSITRSVSNNGWGVPLKFNLNDNTGQRYRYGQITGGITSNSGKTGFLSFAVADGNNWGIAYEQEMMRLTPTGLAIGLSNPIRTLHVNGAIRLNPMVSAPSGGAKGDIYVDANGSINFFNGTKWVNTQQVLELSGDTLKLRDGGSVLLPLSSKAEMLDDLGDAKTLNNSLGLGVHALHSMDSNAYNNVAVGEFSLENLQGAGDNTAVGTRSMRLNTIGGYNTAVGFEALYSNTVGQQNTAIGNNAMWANLSGFQNTALGSHALMNSRVGQGITAVGFGALRNANSSGPNDALGKNSLKNLTVGTSNVAIGVNSLLTLGADSTVEQYRNTVIGSSALMRLEHGTNNVGIGNEVGAWLTGGSYNVIIGGAGSASSGARVIHNNTILGYAAGDKLSNGSNGNTILGNEAFASLSEGSLNIGIGWHAADGITKGGNNIFIGGPNSGPLRVLPINSNVAIGMGTGSSLDSNAYANVFMGENAGNMMRGGSDNVAIGHAALQSSPKGGYNVAVGTQAMQMSDVETSSNTAIGAQSLVNVRSVENTAIGKGSQNQTTTGGGNTSVGASSLTNNTSGSNNVAMGVNSLYNNTSGFSNTSIGTFSLNSNQTGQENVAIGFSAMAGNTTGSLNTAVGLYTLHGYQGLTGNNNTALGAHVLSNTTSGEGNAGLGYWVFPNLKTGSYNIGIGNNVGSNIRGTNENIIIGHEANVGDSLISNSIAIGFQAIVKSSNAIQLGNSATEKVETSGRFEGRGATLRDSTSSGDNAILRLSSNSKGFVFPTMTFDERLSVVPEIGMAIYCKNCGTNGQLQIFNGSVWTDFSGAPAAPKQLAIGDTAFGGVVAYILTPTDSGYSPSVQHGIIIASSDLTYGMQWGCMSLFPTSPNKLEGNFNQQQFGSICQSLSTVAMGATASLILNGKTDWVLPTKDDLAAIYMNRSILSQYLSGGTYWSSTNNVNGYGAWCMNLSNGYVATFLKNDNYHRTKPVRYF